MNLDAGKVKIHYEPPSADEPIKPISDEIEKWNRELRKGTIAEDIFALKMCIAFVVGLILFLKIIEMMYNA